MTMTVPGPAARSVVLVVSAAVCLLAPALAKDSPPPAIVQQFLDRAETPVTSYRALRRLEAHNGRFNQTGWLDAWTVLDPAAGFSYEIASEGGSSYVRNNVLKKTLEREAEAHAKQQTASAAIAPANYEFGEIKVGSDGLVSVELTPRRKDQLLLDGTLHLTADGADLVRVQGRMSKTPSFWTRRVEVVRRYDRISGVRVPVEMSSTAQIFLAGESTFLMRYEYATINGTSVGRPQPRVAPPEQ